MKDWMKDGMKNGMKGGMKGGKNILIAYSILLLTSTGKFLMELIISLYLICYRAKVTPGQPEHEIRYLESLDLESLERNLVDREEIYNPPGIIQEGVFLRISF